MAYNKEAQKKYRDKSMQFTASYRPKEINDAMRLKAYLSQTGLSVNSYLKSLIKADLDSKNVQYVDNVETDQAD